MDTKKLNKTSIDNIKRKISFIDIVDKKGGIPLFSVLDINPTELCNRQCVFCPRSDSNVYPNQPLHMSIDLIKKVAEECKEINFKGTVTLGGFGEPMLNPNIVEFPKYFSRDVRIELVTNGDLLNPKNARKLIDNGLNYFVVSMYDGEHQRDKFTKIFDEAGISSEYYTLRDRWYKEEDDYGLILTNRAGMINIGNQQEIDLKAKCFYLAYSLYIDWNGDVITCCHDWNKKVKFGNIYHESMLEVWRSSYYSKYRKRLINGDRNMSPCNNCNAGGCLHGFNHAKEWIDTYSQ